MADPTPALRSHIQRATFERWCYALLPGLIVAFMAVLMVGIIWPPPSPCLPSMKDCVALPDYGKALVDKAVQVWPVLSAAFLALIGGPAVTLFRGAQDARLTAGGS